jgi:flagellar hook-length control protein FliK
MRQQTQRSDEAKRREKQELAEQVQRNADKRKNDLEQTRLQMIADSRQTQDRRERLDAIDERKALRRQELDRKELGAQLDHRLDQKRLESERLLEPQQTQAGNVQSESPNMLGIARQAVKESENFTPESKPVQAEPLNRDIVVNEFSVQTVEKHATAAQRGNAEHRLKGENASSNEKEVKSTKADSIETGKQMQMLASFSDLSGKIAAALRQHTKQTAPTREPRPGLANRHSVEEAKPDSVPVEKLPQKVAQKMTPEILAALEAALGSKSRKKEPTESGKDNLQSQLQQAEEQHRAATRKANDRPMLDQMERVRLVQRVANACLAASNQSGTLRIKLHPESLGSVSVKIKAKNKTMNIELEAETESAKSILLENASDLKQELQKHGISVEAFTVRVRQTADGRQQATD